MVGYALTALTLATAVVASPWAAFVLTVCLAIFLAYVDIAIATTPQPPAPADSRRLTRDGG
jgi:threonine/homoserine/homoserine lactone efflux protein